MWSSRRLGGLFGFRHAHGHDAENEVLHGLGHTAESGRPVVDDVQFTVLAQAEEPAGEFADREEVVADLLALLVEAVGLAQRQEGVQIEGFPGARDACTTVLGHQCAELTQEALGSGMRAETVLLQ